MGWNNHRISHGGVKIAADGSGDIQLALGSSSKSLIELFALPTVNLWAKYKPFKYAGTFDDTAARNVALANTLFGLGDDQHNLPYSVNYAVIKSYYDNNAAYDLDGDPLNGWSYNRPTDWLRKDDLDDYYSKAECPVAIIPGNPGTVSNQYQGSTFSFGMSALIHDTSYQDDGQLSLWDFPQLRNTYFGAMLIKEDGTQVIFKTGSQLSSAAATSLSVVFDAFNMPTGSWTAYFFMSSIQISQGASTGGATMFPLPRCVAQPFTVVTSLYSARVYNALKSNGVVTANFEVKNDSNVNHTFTGCEARLLYANKDWDDIESAEESAQNKVLGYNGEITVMANSSYTGSLTFRNVDPTLFATCRIWLKIGSTEIDPFPTTPFAPSPD